MESVEENPDVVSHVDIMDGLAFLAQNGANIKINKENMVFVADFFVSLKSSCSSLEAAHLLDGLKFLTDNRFHVPVVVTMATKVVSAAGKGSGIVKVSR